MNNKSLGRYGEDLAAELLERKGYRIIEKNFKNKLGELDIVAKDGRVMVFIEVKSRKSLACGSPFESVHIYKQRKLKQMAQSYLKFRFGTVDILSRFDVVSIHKDASGSEHMEHIANAFDC